MKRRQVNTSTSQNGERRTRPWLRRVGVVVGCLLAGAIINVLVAWGCARSVLELDPVGLVGITSDEEQWLSRVIGFLPVIEDKGSYTWRKFLVTGAGVSRDYYMLRPKPELQSADDRRLHVSYTVSGWPARSMASTRFMSSNSIHHVDQFKWGWNVEVSSRPFKVPLLPVWRGFLINTIVYGVILWILFTAMWSLRRHRRIMRGLCPDCGYDLRGAEHGKCPECGEAVGKRRQQNNRTAKQVAD